MPTEFLKHERDAINRAWDACLAASEAVDWSTVTDLTEALRYERRERSSIHAAKGLCAESWLQGFDDPDTYARRIASMSRGCACALLIGAKVRDRYPENLRPEWRERIEHAATVRQEAVTRALENLCDR